MVSFTAESAHKQAVQIFNNPVTSENGKPFIMCTRCDHIPAVQDRGTYYRVHATGITKAKEHLAVHCPGIRPDVNSEDAAFRHALLLGISEKYKRDMSKKGQAMIAAAEKLERQGGPATHRPGASRAADDNSVGNSDNRQSRAPLLEQLS